MSGAGNGDRLSAANDKDSMRAASGPTAFGKYQLFASLGRGGMADVFLAVARGPMGFNKLVVVKRLRDSLAEESSFLEMFLDEARLAARLNHPNVVHTYEVGEEGGAYFIAMEYLEGQSLNKILREVTKTGAPFEPTICARLASDALAGLHHAHELKDYDGQPLLIVHRDVSPHNVFVTYDGQVKLVDFGIAKAVSSSTETAVGVLKGKVAYMSPEQAMSGPLDRRADLFAMGIVLWEMLTRKRLMDADSAPATLHRLLNLPVPRVSSVVPDIDPRLDDIVAKALEKNPDRRHATALEMREALEGWIAESGVVVRQEDIGRRVSALFKSVREDVAQQIRTQMATLGTATTTAELAALNVDSLRRMGAGSSAHFVALDTTGSGSGVIAVGGEAAATDEGSGKKRGVLYALMFAIVAAAAIVGLLLVQLGQSPAPVAQNASTATATATTTATATATATDPTDAETTDDPTDAETTDAATTDVPADTGEECPPDPECTDDSMCDGGTCIGCICIGGGETGTGECGTNVSTQNAACDECSHASCCPEVQGCFGDETVTENTACLELNNCLATNCQAAGTLDALEMCVEEFCPTLASEIPAFLALNACLGMNCGAACGGG